MNDRILITNRFRAEEGHSFFPANAVRVEIDGETVERRTFRQNKDWDSNARNQLNQSGAIIYSPDWEAIDAAVAEFREKYPGLEIQFNQER